MFQSSWGHREVGWWNIMHTWWYEAKQNVVLKMRNFVLHGNMLNAAWLGRFAGGCGGAVWSEASECDVFIGLLLSDCLISLPAHCLCQLLFKGISLQVQLRRESLVPWTWFYYFFYLVFIWNVCWLSLWGRVPTVGFLSQRGNKTSRCSSAFEARGPEKKMSSYTNTLWC